MEAQVPRSAFVLLKSAWDQLLVMATVYSVFIVPLNVCFNCSEGLPLLVTVELLFILDFLGNLWNHLTSDGLTDEVFERFVQDCLSAVPVHLMQMFGVKISSWLSMMKLLHAERLTNFAAYITSGTFRHFWRIVVPGLIFHWIICASHFMSLYELSLGYGWMYELGATPDVPYIRVPHGEPSLFLTYIMAAESAPSLLLIVLVYVCVRFRRAGPI
ncbi:hypothetical protein WMY93_015742 [Mugilogobius chulae]|uniref:Ion transport domain-containing protein n=1 Tax=Mugilogobius chulae TaxID=88201 RepID=A0AAW0NRF4_9GOBI